MTILQGVKNTKFVFLFTDSSVPEDFNQSKETHDRGDKSFKFKQKMRGWTKMTVISTTIIKFRMEVLLYLQNISM
jgi:hypothetical protein